MRLRARHVAVPAVFVGALVTGCGGEGSTSGSDDVRADEAVESPTPTCDRACRAARRRADRKAVAAARCRDLRAQVGLTYRFTATPVAGGKEIRLRLTIANRSGALTSGATSGVLAVDSGRGANRIVWGGSSADELYLDPRSVATVEAVGRNPEQHPVGQHVTSFHVSTYLYPPGRGLVACFMPARVVAPPGLVSGHPSGRWTQQSRRRF